MLNDNVIAYKSECSKLNALQSNAKLLEAYASWCESVIRTRMQLQFLEESVTGRVFDHQPPSINDDISPLGQFISHNDLDFRTQLLLILALIPYVKPQIFDVFLSRNEGTDRPYTEFGGVEFQGMWVATGETLAFLLGGPSIEKRLEVQRFITLADVAPEGLKEGEQQVVRLLDSAVEHNSNPLRKPLILASEHVSLFTTGEDHIASMGHGFPAQVIATHQTWEDVTLPSSTLEQIDEIKGWALFGAALHNDWGLGSKIRPGYRALFYGPPGTGKTLTAGILGNTLNKTVYKVDLSRVTSKYIGETEKNLEKVFSLVEQNEGLLFFDEADAVFGQRTQTSNANDQFANQHVSYLLQRIERFKGLVVLASNYKDNFDDAFFRRFESVIQFSLPEFEQRLSLWQNGFSDKCKLEDGIDLRNIAMKHSLSAASIMNVIRFASLRTLSRGETKIRQIDLDKGIERELGGKNGSRW